MILSKVTIKNFRSIRNQTLKFFPKCRVLVGMNESGKTNILRALSMISDKQNPSNDDIREPLPNENPVEESFIRFVFELEENEQHQIFENSKSKIICKNKNKPILIKDSENVSLEQFCASQKEGLYKVDIKKVKKYPAQWSIDDSLYKVIASWKKPSEKCPANYTINITNQENICLSSVNIINIEDFPDIPIEYLSSVSVSDFGSIVGAEIISIVKEKLPDCIFWVYNEDNLLPGKIDLHSFRNNPSMCLPLKYMFHLSKIGDIPTAIDEAINRPNGIRNLLKRVAEITTKHIINIWKEYKTIRIFLSENGPFIEAGIEDKFNIYNFNRRSDGFKRFITFLLMISAKERTKQLSNTLLIIDEPDIELHPSGARYLKNELLKISETNYVIYSTHSIFMIDRDNLARHLIVKKEREITSLIEASQSNILDEEVLYNALGYSIFESLKKKNIVFEGWRDKQLYKVALSSTLENHKHIILAFKDIGICHAEGVKDIQRVTAILELANRECFIVSDDDNVAKQYQSQYQKNRGYGKWLRYSEILHNTTAITGEDFIKASAFINPISNIIKKYPQLSNISDKDLHGIQNKLSYFNKWLDAKRIDSDIKKGVLDSIKEEVFNNLKPSQIEDSYFDFLNNLVTLLTSPSSI